MKLNLSAEELFIIKQAIESITIKGKDALDVGKILEKITKAFDTESEKTSPE